MAEADRTRIYIDHNATTPVRPEVVDVVATTLAECGGNPSSAHRSGRHSRERLEEARASVAASIGAKPHEIVFTASGTEANNLALRGTARKAGAGTIVTSNIEHPAVEFPCNDLEEAGFAVERIPVDVTGRVDARRFSQSLSDATCLVSLIHAQNETGVLQPARAVGDACRERGIPFHTDAAQSIGKVRLNVTRDPFDLVTIVGHKFYAPKGIGALYIREGLSIKPLILGGGQESGRRPGTENVALAAGLAAALELMVKELPGEKVRIRAMRDRFEEELTRSMEGVTVVGAGVDRLPGTSCLLFDGLFGYQIAGELDRVGIEISTGSACHAGSPEPSAVLLAMGIEPGLATGAIRVGFGRGNREEDVDRLVEELIAAGRRLSGDE